MATVNGVERKVSKSAEIKNSNTYVPVRFISELIDYEVHFKKEVNKSIIEITSPIVEKPVDKVKADEFVNDGANNEYIFNSLNKVLCMQPTKGAKSKVYDYYNYSYFEVHKAPKKEDALKYESHISDMSLMDTSITIM